MLHRLPIVLAHAVLQEIQERHALAFGASVDHRVIDSHHGIRDGASWPKRRAQIGAGQIRENLFKSAEEEHLVSDDRSTDCSAELLAAKISEGLPVRRARRQRFKPLVMESAAMNLVRTGFSDDVDYAAGGAAEFRVGAACNHLELLHRVQRDGDGRALAAELLAEETVVVIAAVEADVVEDAALAVEVDFITVGPLRDGHARCQDRKSTRLNSSH